MRLDTARRLALSLPEATEEDHHGRPSFRVAGRIFATVPDARHLHVMLDAETVSMAVATDPAAFEELHWGRSLAGVRVVLASADRARVEDLLRRAWLRRAPARLAREFGDPDGDA